MECIIDDLTVYYEAYGEGRPVLCLHGNSVDHRLMSGCLEPVFAGEAGYRRIYLDLPGMGRTPAKPWVRTADDLLRVITRFTEVVIGQESFLLVGESYGGYLSLGLLQSLSAQVEGLLLICPVIYAQGADRRLPPKRLLVRDEGLEAGIDPSDMASFLSTAVVATRETYARFAQEVLCGLKLGDTAHLQRVQREGYSLSCEEELRAMVYEGPCCILTGRQDHVVGYEDALALAARWPRASIAVLDCAGHNLQIEQPALFTAHVKAWLERVAAGSSPATFDGMA